MREILIDVQLETREVWSRTNPDGSVDTELRNVQFSPIVGDSLSVRVLESGLGTVDRGEVVTDAHGHAWASFRAGPDISTVQVTHGGSGATGQLTFSCASESWSPEGNQSLVSAFLSPIPWAEDAPTGTDGLSPGDTRLVQVNVQCESWTVEVSNYGNRRTVDASTSPAAGAQIAWSIDGGDGSVGTESPLQTDAAGNATATFTMADQTSNVRADVTFDGTDQTFALLQFTTNEPPPPGDPEEDPEETWVETDVWTEVSVTLSADGTTEELSPGDGRNVTAHVTGVTHVSSISNFGNIRETASEPFALSGVNVTFSRRSGDGSVSPGVVATDQDGNATVGFTMGQQPSQVMAEYLGVQGFLDFSPVTEVFTVDPSLRFARLAIGSLEAAGPVDDLSPGATRTISACVVWDWFNVEISNFNREREVYESSEPAPGVAVGFSVPAGDGELSTDSGTTNAGGVAAVGFTMGSESSTVQVDAVDAGSASIELRRPPIDWQFGHLETTVSATPNIDMLYTSDVHQGSQQEVTVHVTFDSHEVWVGDGNPDLTDLRNPAGGIARGAMVRWSIAEGDGTVSPHAPTDEYGWVAVDANGNAKATFTMGVAMSRVRAEVQYCLAASDASLEFLPDGWVYQRSASDLNLTLSADVTQMTAHVFRRDWDVYAKEGAEDEEVRNMRQSSLNGVPVVLQAGANVTISGAASGTTSGNGNFSVPYRSSPGGQSRVTVTAQPSGQMLTQDLNLDADGDGLPDALELQFGGGGPGGATGLDPNATRYVNGQTEGLTYQEAYEAGKLTVLANLNAVEVAISAGAFPEMTAVPTGRTKLQAAYDDIPPGSGTATFTYEDVDDEDNPVTITVMGVLDPDVLGPNEVGEYLKWANLGTTQPPTLTANSKWRTPQWTDNVEELTYRDGTLVRHPDNSPVRKGSWSGRYGYAEVVDDPDWIITGASAGNDRMGAALAALDPPPSNIWDLGDGQAASETYHFTDPENPEGPGGGAGSVPIAEDDFPAMAGAWRTMSPLTEASQKTYSQYQEPTASLSSDGIYGSNLAFWLNTEDGQPAVREIKRLYVKTTTGSTVIAANGGASAAPPGTSELAQMFIPKGHVSSNIIQLQPAAGTTVRLDLVELLQHPIDEASGAAAPPPSNNPIRFCRWIDAYTNPNGVRDNTFADTDRDRFQIRIPGVIPGLTKIRIKSTGINGAMIGGVYQDKTTDGDYEVDMSVNNGNMVSTPILLVADGDDDKTFNGVGAADDGWNDQTLLANFDSQIIVSFPEFGNATATFVAQPANGQIELDVVYCSPGGGVPANIETLINRQIYVMRGIYRQIGIRVKASGIRVLQFPAAWTQAQGAADPAGNLTATETEDLFGLLEAGRSGGGEIPVRAGFVNAALNDIVNNANISIYGRLGRFGVCLVSLDAGGRIHLNTLAHEVGHACTLPHQRRYEDENTKLGGEHWLMKDGAFWENNSNTAKRFFIGVEDIKIKSPNDKYYVPIP